MKNIKFNNVSIKLNNKVLFENINFELKSGDKIMFLGKNGSGKSLFFELIAFGFNKDLCSRYKGLEVEGSIIDDNGIDYLNPNSIKPIVYVSQDEDFYNNSTIIDEAKISCVGSNVDFDEEYFDYLLNKFNLADKKRKKIKNNVSFGEGKVIHIITKLLKVKDGDIIILDEPLNHLSFQNSKIFNDVINELTQKFKNLTILCISHCKAIDFLDVFMKYDYNKKEIYFTPYKSVKCFDDDEFERNYSCQ